MPFNSMHSACFSMFDLSCDCQIQQFEPFHCHFPQLELLDFPRDRHRDIVLIGVEYKIFRCFVIRQLQKINLP